MLRVIAGKYRNRKLKQPPLSISRPTMERTREAIFSMFQFKIENKIFLDLFSGSGAIGIEASSRGAMKVYCVDNNLKSIKVIKENIDTIGIKNIQIINSNAINFIKSKKGTDFDFVYLDPPFSDYDLYNEVLLSISENNILAKEAYIILETNDPSKLKIPHSFTEYKIKKYGKTFVVIITNNI